PLDAFHCNDPGRTEKFFELLDDIGCNALRCWGGNVYESDRFYDLCDELGIMVWQDFAMGCAVYPQDCLFAEKIEREATYQVKRLRNHPSVILYAGDNEGDICYRDWIGFRRDPGNNFITRQVLKRVCESQDYTRPYLPSSPFVSPAVTAGGVMPEEHLWGPRDYFKGAYYKDTFCHFASETGYHGFPSPESLRRFLREPEKIFNDDGTPTEEYLVHAASPETDQDAPFAYRIRLAYNQVLTLFGGVGDSLGDFVRRSQISQGEAKKYFIEKFRIGKPIRTGIIWWNLLDGWPQVSDAVADYYFTKKLAYHYIRRSQQPLCLMFDEPKDGRLTLFGVNDTTEPAEVEYKVTRVSDGEILLKGAATITTDKAVEIDSVPADDKKEFLLIEWWEKGERHINHYFTNVIEIDYNKYIDALKKCGMYEFEGFEL
ncbi:MAG: glycoside hydrolase family 2, partial [Abditibacteriota bacterium]|nr:glycoside hydrolase family 2 [Abditibacteriota bacterium]